MQICLVDRGDAKRAAKLQTARIPSQISGPKFIRDTVNPSIPFSLSCLQHQYIQLTPTVEWPMAIDQRLSGHLLGTEIALVLCKCNFRHYGSSLGSILLLSPARFFSCQISALAWCLRTSNAVNTRDSYVSLMEAAYASFFLPCSPSSSSQTFPNCTKQR